jgi:hypothetical protein
MKTSSIAIFVVYCPSRTILLEKVNFSRGFHKSVNPSESIPRYVQKNLQIHFNESGAEGSFESILHK